VDQETISPLLPACEQQIAAFLAATVPLVQVIAISDYGKGFLTPSLLRLLITLAKEHKIPCVIDPKGTDFLKYRGVDVIKPNLTEAYAAAKLPMSATLDAVARNLLAETEADFLVITRSEAGISCFEKCGLQTDFPVRTKEVKDVTGAGDTVLSTLCLSMASGLSMAVGIQLANIAATISIERLGCVQVTLPEIARRLLELDVGTKIYDENHMYVLCQVLKNKCYTLLVLNGEGVKEMNPTLFRTIRKLSQKENSELIIYAKTAWDDEWLELLSSLHEVDFIITQQESLERLLEIVRPEEIYFLENDEKELLSGLLSCCANDAATKTKISLVKND
jgi:D-beta-D-heptose 7-phosphate kinase/D-beta-D-heptose 1-phosphate adenosyltransferase